MSETFCHNLVRITSLPLPPAFCTGSGTDGDNRQPLEEKNTGNHQHDLMARSNMSTVKLSTSEEGENLECKIAEEEESRAKRGLTGAEIGSI